jgi:adenine-specific DNA-methyltransferase
MVEYMDNKKLKDKIFETLKADNRLWDEEKRELNQTLLLDLVEKIDENVIGLLLADSILKEKFFVLIKDVYVFKTNDFRFFIEENRVYNSYTQYKNRIGLTDGKKFLKDSSDVVLDWPYKDCVLEGGQAKEDGLDSYYEYNEKVTKTEEKKGYKANSYNLKQTKRKEVFFNQVIAYDEIDRLFDKKALINWKRFTKDGKQKVKEIKRDKDGTIKENLIIKGNNLLALHSLKSEFKGKVKLIYIDPPYNTGNDSFAYNDKFNHSSWLTFMKNRLEIAKDLLRDDGVIFVQCDDNEQAYLKVLMDEVFGRENFVANLVWRKKTGAADAKAITTITETIITFIKNKEYTSSSYTRSTSHDITRYKLSDKYEKRRGKHYIDNLDRGGISYSKALNYPIICPDGTKTYPNGRKEFIEEGWTWTWSENKVLWGIENGFIEFRKSEKKDSGWSVCYKNYLYVNNKDELSQRTSPHKNLILDCINTEATKELFNLFNQKVFNFPKPENLIQKIINMATKEGDIVLDYHLGSGTTCAVAHKMGRQYIGIEQMDYIEDITCERLKKVIDGEQGGISKSVEWKGGGDFIYFELSCWNEKAKELIFACENLESLIKLFDTLYETYFLNYNLKIKEFKDKVIKEDNFKALSLEEQKKMFLTMLDLNQMYVQKTEMEDKKYGINKEDIHLTNEFYNFQG